MPELPPLARMFEEAESQLNTALFALREGESIDDVFAAISLADLALRIGLGETPADEWPEESEPLCICPPELVARGGFKGGCPAHA